jgi:Bacteriophage tail sheath protein
MPVSPTYPGVYVEEIPSGVRTIAGVSTSTTAFVGRALRGRVNDPVIIHSFEDFEREFGGLWIESAMSFSVNQFFANGGGEAVIIRVFNGNVAASTANFTLADNEGPPNQLDLEAASPGVWANDLKITADNATAKPDLINLTVRRGTDPTPLETLRNLSFDTKSGAFITTVLKQRSAFLRVKGTAPAALKPNPDITVTVTLPGGNDGGIVGFGNLVPNPPDGTGIYALGKADIFNILCLPPPNDSFTETQYNDAYSAAATYCGEKRAMLIIDPLAVKPVDIIKTPGNINTAFKENAALYYPAIRALNPLKPGIIEDFPPSGAIAGVWARTDVARGVWKAPAGTDTAVAGVQGLSESLNDADSGQLNPRAVNALRTFPTYGTIVWGARTLDGDDKIGSEWKYVPVRRIALYIEESLFRGLKWVVFEPNSEPLWAQIRLNVGAFMQGLFRQGAFQGKTPADAYFVACDASTTTQNDINLGIVNIIVGFAPLKPAEFVVLRIQQMAGQIET